jgi:hypothetical protein
MTSHRFHCSKTGPITYLAKENTMQHQFHNLNLVIKTLILESFRKVERKYRK